MFVFVFSKKIKIEKMQNKTKKIATDMRHLHNAALKIFKLSTIKTLDPG